MAPDAELKKKLAYIPTKEVVTPIPDESIIIKLKLFVSILAQIVWSHNCCRK